MSFLKFLFFTFLLLFSLNLFEPAEASNASCTHYIATTGLSTNLGTIGSPWDLTSGLLQSSSTVPAGSVVCLRGGTYTGVFTSTLSGTSDDPIIVQSYPGEKAVIDGYSTGTLQSTLPGTGSSHSCQFDFPYTLRTGSYVVIGTEEIRLSSPVGNNTFTCTRAQNGTTVAAHSIGNTAIHTHSGILTIEGEYSWFQDLEIMSSYTERSFIAGGYGSSGIIKPPAVYIDDKGVKIINNYIHDVGHPAIANYYDDSGCDMQTAILPETNTCDELYGNIISGAGFYDPAVADQRRGSGVYTQNRYGTKIIRDNFFLKNFTTGINIYTQASYVNNFHVEGNTLFDNGDDEIWAASNPGADEMKNLMVKENYTYTRADVLGNGGKFGYHLNNQSEANILDNYFVSGHASTIATANFGADTVTSPFLNVEGNTIFKRSSTNYMIEARVINALGTTGISWDHNIYFAPLTTLYNIVLEGITTTNAVGGGRLRYSETPTMLGKGWKEWSNFDASSTYTAGNPPDTSFVRANKYDSDRFNLTIYNWSRGNSYSQDFTNSLTPGNTYELWDVQDMSSNTPFMTFTYTGAPVSISMTNTGDTAPSGTITHMATARTDKEFNAFIIKDVTVPDVTLPTVSITSPSVSSTFSTTSPSVTISGTASDDTLLDGVTYTVDGGGELSVTGTDTWSFEVNLSVGVDTIVVIARDAAGNIGTDTITITRTSVSSESSSSGGGGGGGRKSTTSKKVSIPGCDNRTTGFSTISGKSCIDNLVNGSSAHVIPGCDGRTTGFSTVTGEPCGNGVVTSRIYDFGLITLRNGSTGEAVKELQRFLNDRLGLGLVVDGKLGPKTIAVIKKWQFEYGLVPDGLVGPKTKALMNSI